MREQKSSKKFIIVLAVVLVLVAIGGFFVWNNYNNSNKEINTDQFEQIEGTLVDLSSLEEDLIISKGGTYTLNGETVHSVKVSAPDEDVKLILNDVKITQSETAAIIGEAAKSLTIELKDGSENSLSDGGASDYDACIFSNADLYFTGNGSLTVVGQQEEGEGIATEAKNMTFSDNGIYYITSVDDGLNAGGDGGTITINGGNFYIDASGDGIDSNQNAIINGGTIFVMGSDIGGDAGIDTDDGFTINGGSVIALGSDMIEAPLADSKQNSLAITLDETIAANTTVALMRDEEMILAFEAPKSFKTLIISDSALAEGNYSLEVNGEHSGTVIRGVYYVGEYTKGEKIVIDGNNELTVANGVNTFGRSLGRPGNNDPNMQRPDGPAPGQPGETPPEPR